MSVPGSERRKLKLVAVAVSAALVCACADSAGPVSPDALVVIQGAGQMGAAGVALPIDPIVEVVDASGQPMPDVRVSFLVVAGNGIAIDTAVVTDANGRARTSWILGPSTMEPHHLRARANGVSVDITAQATTPETGATYVGRNGYVDYVVGDLPIVITAPHGGTMQPAEIPDRTVGATVRDANTDVLAQDISDAFAVATGRRPHLIVLRLHRLKLDANREILEAAAGHPLAERTWHEFQSFTEAALQAVEERWGSGFYIDLHGHAHAIARLELGYRLTGDELALPDGALNALADETSIRSLADRSPLLLTQLLRGASSLGTLFELEGYPAVPSGQQPHPAGEPYFSGGYNTYRHGSSDGGTVDGVQIECNFAGVRDTAPNRAAFATALARVFRMYFSTHYDLDLDALETACLAGVCR